MNFTKMEGLGNDYIYIDTINQKFDLNYSDLAKKFSNRNFGVGSDGIILIEKSEIADFKMRIFNKDGSEAEMCGNGIRCVGKYVYDNNLTDKLNLTIETKSGIKYLNLIIQNNEVSEVIVDMGKATLNRKISLNILDNNFNLDYISIGNPHAVCITDLDINKYGNIIENDSNFINRTNVEFVKIIDKNNIEVSVWERGVGETLACGTGACAAFFSCYINNLVDNEVNVILKGGVLVIKIENDHIYMKGPCNLVYEGKIKEIRLI